MDELLFFVSVTGKGSVGTVALTVLDHVSGQVLFRLPVAFSIPPTSGPPDEEPYHFGG